MRDQEVFNILGLGPFRFVVSLAGVEFPYIFVAQRISDRCDTFLFYQIDSNEFSVSWAATQISFTDFDDLNRGKISVQDCFWGPRRTPKSGYIVRSVSGHENATCEAVADIYSFLGDDEPFYPDEFVSEEHGSGPLSLFVNAPVFSVVANEDRYCLPEMTSARMNDCSKEVTKMLKNLPFNINSKPKFYLIGDHSFVINFEIVDADKKSESPEQLKLDLGLDDESEARAALKAIESVMSGDATEKDLIDNFNGSVEALDKCVGFIKSLSRFNRNGVVNVALSNPSKNQERFKIEKRSVERITETVKKAKDFIENTAVPDPQEFKRRGRFKMIDQTGKTGFKFQPDGEDKMIRGYFECPDKTRDTQYSTNREYLATFKTIIFRGESWCSKPITKLVSAKEVPEYQQTNLFDK